MHLLTLKTILVAVAGDDASRAGVRAGATLAASAGAALHAVHVTDDPAVTSETFAQSTLHGIDARIHIVRGSVSNSIRSIADRLKADVIVLGPHRGGTHAVREQALGATALAVVTNASAPCLIVSQTLELPLRRVLAPVDLSDTSKGALLVALSWASALRPQREDARPLLTALYVGSDERAVAANASRVRALEQQVAELRDVGGRWAGVDIEHTTVVGTDTPTAIAQYATEHDAGLVVLGTRGLGLDPIGRVGSVAGDTIKRVDLPVLLVPPAMWLAHAPTR
jgi:nucleotide-binding universal stress UspA family protein